jgi:macrolide transport system ATP-binding/permease protein
METLLQDLRYGLRSLLRRPSFAAVTVLSLALGIGANTTIFSLLNAILLRPLAFEEPERLAELYTVETKADNYLTVSYPDYTYFRDNNEVFSELAAHGIAMLSLSGGNQNELVWGEIVSGNYFSVLGVKAFAGRTFSPEEDQTPGAHPVAVVSHGLWTRRFGSAPDLIGKTVMLNGHSFTVVGIAPEGFKGTIVGLSPDIWVPLMMQAQAKPGPDLLNKRDARALFIIGRLKPGVDLEQAQTSMKGLARQLEQSYTDTNKGIGVALLPARALPPQFRTAVAGFMIFLMAVAVLVLLVACANVANLLLARATGRRKEIAIRLALGASRGRLIRQLLTESILLSLCGGVLGLLIAFIATRLLLAFKLPLPVQIALDLSLDIRVLGFTLLMSLLTGIIFGLVPALQSSQPDLVPALKDEATGRGHKRSRLLNALVVTQVALSFVLLIGAGLLIRSLQYSQASDPGFDVKKVLAITLDLQIHGYTEARGRSFYEQLLGRTEALPGVESASLASQVPLGLEYRESDVFIEGYQPVGDKDKLEIDFSVVGPKYFQTLGIPLLQGRDFSDQDQVGVLPVAIINESMAHRFWPGADLSTMRFSTTGIAGPYLQVIGIAKDSKYRTVGETPRLFIYLPFRQRYESHMTLLIRTTGDPKSVLSSARGQVQALDANLPLLEAKTLTEHVAGSLLPQRIGATLLGIFGVLGLILAAVGIYGTVAYSVAERTREIGIRVALGAQQRDVLRLIVGQALKLTLTGVAIGLVAAFALSRVMSNLLYGVTATDPLTFVIISALLVGVTVAASSIPAFKAARIDPLIALRNE